MQVGGRLVVETGSTSCAVKQAEERHDDGIKEGLFYIDHKGAKRCAITWMLVGNVCSLYMRHMDAMLREGGA